MTLRHLARAALTTAGVSAPTLVEAATGRLQQDVCDRRLEQWSRRLLEQARMQLTVQGLEHASGRSASDGSREHWVVMSNHQSLYDIPVIFQALKRRIRMVTKRELFRIPIWGRAMRVAGFVEVDRQDHERAIESMRRAAELLRSGTDIWIAPEGTRSRDGKLGPFRKGGFHLAIDTGSRILPVTIQGTRAALPADGTKVHPGASVQVTVHPPIAPRDYEARGIEALMQAVRAAIAGPLGEDQLTAGAS